MEDGQNDNGASSRHHTHQGYPNYASMVIRSVLQDDDGKEPAMSKEQFFIRVQALYNAGGTIWPIEVEFTHTTGEPPPLVDRLISLSKAGFIPANQVAVAPTGKIDLGGTPPTCPIHHKPMKVSQYPPKEGGAAWYCTHQDHPGADYCAHKAKDTPAKGRIYFEKSSA